MPYLSVLTSPLQTPPNVSVVRLVDSNKVATIAASDRMMGTATSVGGVTSPQQSKQSLFDSFVMSCLRRLRTEDHPSCDVILRCEKYPIYRWSVNFTV